MEQGAGRCRGITLWAGDSVGTGICSGAGMASAAWSADVLRCPKPGKSPKREAAGSACPSASWIGTRHDISGEQVCDMKHSHTHPFSALSRKTEGNSPEVPLTRQLSPVSPGCSWGQPPAMEPGTLGSALGLSRHFLTNHQQPEMLCLVFVGISALKLSTKLLILQMQDSMTAKDR